MKTIGLILAALTLCAITSCSKDEAQVPTEQIPPPSAETPLNKAPGALDLVDVANGDVGIDLKPTFSWKAAIDPEAAAVTYDLYLDEQEEPTTMVAANLTVPNFTATDSLHIFTDYRWKVLAKDPKGASVSSTVNTFTTRTLNFPDNPVTDDAGFTRRSKNTMVAFKRNLWVIGGYDGGYKNDVWNSRDGKIWKKVSMDEHPSRDLFSPRRGHTSVVFGNKLWVIGGRGNSDPKNDVWSSSDGISWTEVTKNAPFSERYDHTTVIFQNKLWVIGGYEGSPSFGTINDVWSSTDGANWQKETMAAGFSRREDHSTVVFHDKLWVIGGIDIDKMNDVWSSPDGKNWTEVTSRAEFPPFSGGSAVVFDDKIMLFGVENDQNPAYDIWYSKDGKFWLSMTQGESYPFLGFSETTIFKNKIWTNVFSSKKIWALD